MLMHVRSLLYMAFEMPLIANILNEIAFEMPLHAIGWRSNAFGMFSDQQPPHAKAFRMLRNASRDHWKGLAPPERHPIPPSRAFGMPGNPGQHRSAYCREAPIGCCDQPDRLAEARDGSRHHSARWRTPGIYPDHLR